MTKKMVVEFKSSVLKESAEFNALRNVLNIRIHKYRYKFHLEYPEVKQSSTFQRINSGDQEVIEEIYNRSIKESWNFSHVICEENSEYYSLEEASKLLSEKFLIFFENSDNDACFFNALIKCFKKQSKIINRHKSEIWIKYRMGAGGNMMKSIKSEMDHYKGLPKENHKYIRCFVILDSDRNYPTEPYKKELVDLISFLNQNEIKYHVLEKREIENYMPEEVYYKIKGNEKFISVYKNLSPIQKDYLDIECGLKDKNFNDLDENIQNLYDDVSDKSKKILRKNDIGIEKFKTEFPKLFLDEKVTKKTLLARCSHQNNPNELSDLLNRITGLL